MIIMKLFGSNCKLNLFDNKIEQRYQKEKLDHIKQYNLYLLIPGFLLSISTLLIYYFTKGRSNHKEDCIFKSLPFLGWINIGVNIFLLILYFLLNKSILTQNILNHINFPMIFFSLETIKYTIIYNVSKDYYLIYFLSIIEFLVTILWVLIKFFDFMEMILISLLLISINFVVNTLLTHYWKTFSINFFSFNILQIITIFITYFITRERKSCFYYHQIVKKSEYYENILEVMNAGFFLVENDNIRFMNNFLIDLFSNKRLENNLLNNNDPDFKSFEYWSSHIDHKKFVFDLLKEVIFEETKESQSSLTHLTSYENLVIFLKKMYSSQNKGKCFLFLGKRSFLFKKNSLSEIVLEVFFRFNDDEENQTIFEFVLNNVKKVKKTEENRKQSNGKSLILSKIAHEFKNLLINISGLIDEEFSINPQNSRLKLIKSFSEYLIILIKDLDYFSSNKCYSNITTIKKLVNLEPILKFCENIAHGMLIKYNKQETINFKVIKYNEISDKIYTDELRLKQVIINLISNAIKFTISGKITLGLKNKNNIFLDIFVKDTGIGISNEQKLTLFDPYMQGISNLNNNYGAGLGLSIVHDITKVLGSKIEVESRIGKGTKFWFSIPLRKEHKCLSVNIEEEEKILRSRLDVCLPLDCQSVKNTDKLSLDEDSDQKTIVIGERTRVLNVTKLEEIYINNSLDESTSNINRDMSIENELSICIKKILNVIVADDEDIIRKSTMKLLNKVIENRPFTLNIIESRDGIETIYILYNYLKKGKIIHCIISDQTMNFYEGTRSYNIISEILQQKNMEILPFYLLSSYENLVIHPKIKTISKPLSISNANEIINAIEE